MSNIRHLNKGTILTLALDIVRNKQETTICAYSGTKVKLLSMTLTPFPKFRVRLPDKSTITLYEGNFVDPFGDQ
jgi:hypothetical protein